MRSEIIVPFPTPEGPQMIRGRGADIAVVGVEVWLCGFAFVEDVALRTCEASKKWGGPLRRGSRREGKDSDSRLPLRISCIV